MVNTELFAPILYICKVKVRSVTPLPFTPSIIDFLTHSLAFLLSHFGQTYYLLPLPSSLTFILSRTLALSLTHILALSLTLAISRCSLTLILTLSLSHCYLLVHPFRSPSFTT